MGKIVAIGGGEIGRAGYSVETIEIDREIIRLSGKKDPRVLFIPTASSDSSEYISIFKEHYGKRLGCKVEILYLKGNVKRKDVEAQILSSDIVYVGGGNTLRMMMVWRKLGIDKLLRKALDKGIVLSGLSAGAICWFDFGHSDSRRFTSKNVSWNFIKVKGLGFYHFIFCPHYHFEKREKDFQNLIQRDGGVGLAFDNNTALEIVDDKFRVLKSDKNAKAYRVLQKNGKVITEELKTEGFQLLQSFTVSS